MLLISIHYLILLGHHTSRLILPHLYVSIDPTVHTFSSTQFQTIVEEVITFFNETPVRLLPPDSFNGPGVYGLYYTGDFEPYENPARANNTELTTPIYVGKAVPTGWRQGRTSRNYDAPHLYRRLREHARSIKRVDNLLLEDFQCRFVILVEEQSDLITLVEASLTRKYTPLWNSYIDGFGNHDPGSGRYDQAPSEWDTLHPGRPWVEKLTGEGPNRNKIIAKIP